MDALKKSLDAVSVTKKKPAKAVRKKRKKVTKPPPVAKDQASRIMRCMKPMEQLPALATLAKTFALCTRWHCSVPGATWPNRNFAHAGTSDGTVDIEIGFYTNLSCRSNVAAIGMMSSSPIFTASFSVVTIASAATSRAAARIAARSEASYR